MKLYTGCRAGPAYGNKRLQPRLMLLHQDKHKGHSRNHPEVTSTTENHEVFCCQDLFRYDQIFTRNILIVCMAFDNKIQVFGNCILHVYLINAFCRSTRASFSFVLRMVRIQWREQIVKVINYKLDRKQKLQVYFQRLSVLFLRSPYFHCAKLHHIVIILILKCILELIIRLQIYYKFNSYFLNCFDLDQHSNIIISVWH